MRVGVVIPARDEAEALPRVFARLPGLLDGDETRVVLCANACRDRTAAVARDLGMEVVEEPQPGYGAACRRALERLGSWPDAAVFLDADGSCNPSAVRALLDPIRRGEADLVLGSRDAAPGSMTLTQRWGTQLALLLLRLRWGVRAADLAPARAIRREALERLHMDDRTWGWTFQMQIQAARHGLRVREVRLPWARRVAGRSKISGTALGAARAGARILWTFARYALRSSPGASRDLVVVFLKEPVPGRAKTRLAPWIGDEGAARLYRRLAEDTVLELRRPAEWETEIRFDPPEAEERVAAWLCQPLPLRPQLGDDLGERLEQAISEGFARGATRVVVVGTDCPALTAATVRAAFTALEEAEVVLGPAADGGFYLLGLRRPVAGLFSNIPWSTADVAAAIRERIRAAGSTLQELRVLRDIDTGDDLAAAEREGVLAGPR